MIKIKRLLSYGGACPYQLEAITTDDKWLYIRYRHGVLSCSLADSREKWMKDFEEKGVIEKAKKSVILGREMIKDELKAKEILEKKDKKVKWN